MRRVPPRCAHELTSPRPLSFLQGRRTHASNSPRTRSNSGSRSSCAGRAPRRRSCSRSAGARRSRRACSSPGSCAGVSSGRSTRRGREFGERGRRGERGPLDMDFSFVGLGRPPCCCFSRGRAVRAPAYSAAAIISICVCLSCVSVVLHCRRRRSRTVMSSFSPPFVWLLLCS